MNNGIGEVRTKLLDTDHRQWNCGMGIFKPGVVYWEENPEGRVIIDGKRCKILSKTEYDKNYVLIGGKNYKIVTIGNQVWTVENLDWLPGGIEFIDSGSETYTTPAACYYNFTDNGKGLLYNGYAIETINQLLPAGWRVPHKSDYDDLFTTIGGNTVANIKKIRSTSGWPSIQGTDDYGLNIYPTGHRSGASWIGPDYAYLWTDSIQGSYYYRVKIEQNAVADITSFNKVIFYAVRLVKDA